MNFKRSMFSVSPFLSVLVGPCLFFSINYEVGGLSMQNQENRSLLQVSLSSYSGSFLVSATITHLCKQFLFQINFSIIFSKGGSPVDLV